MKLKIIDKINLKVTLPKLTNYIRKVFFSKYDDFLILYESSYGIFILKLENKELVFSTYGLFEYISEYVIDEEKEYVFFIANETNTYDYSLYAYGIYDKTLYFLDTLKHPQLKESFSFIMDFEKKEIITDFHNQAFKKYQKYSYFLNKDKEELELTFISDVNTNYRPKWEELEKIYAIEKNKDLIALYAEYDKSKDNKLFAVSIINSEECKNTDEDQIIAIVYNLENNSIVNYLRHDSYYEVESIDGEAISFINNSNYLLVIGSSTSKYTLYIFNYITGILEKKMEDVLFFSISNDSKLLIYDNYETNKEELIIAEIII